LGVKTAMHWKFSRFLKETLGTKEQGKQRFLFIGGACGLGRETGMIFLIDRM